MSLSRMGLPELLLFRICFSRISTGFSLTTRLYLPDAKPFLAFLRYCILRSCGVLPLPMKELKPKFCLSLIFWLEMAALFQLLLNEFLFMKSVFLLEFSFFSGRPPSWDSMFILSSSSLVLRCLVVTILRFSLDGKFSLFLLLCLFGKSFCWTCSTITGAKSYWLLYLELEALPMLADIAGPSVYIWWSFNLPPMPVR